MLKKKDKKSNPWVFALPVLLLAVLVVWQIIVRYEGSVPEIQMSDLQAAISMSSELSFKASDDNSGIRKIWVGMLQNGKETVLFEKEFSGKGLFGGDSVTEFPVRVPFDPKNNGIADGEVILRISVRDFSWRKWWHGNIAYVEKTLTVDTRPAQIEVLTNAHNVTQGGVGLIMYRLSEACPKSGVAVGDNFFPGMAGYFKDPLVYLCFFALGHDQGTDTPLSLEASDIAGNESRTGFYHHLRRKNFKTDTIAITDNFLNAKLPEFNVAADEEGTLSAIEKFLKINGDIRREDYETIVGITAQTDNVLHWQGVFRRLPGAANRAGYAEARTYTYKGQIIDHQTHMGIDLASVAHSQIPAANAGRVAFSGRIGIYGNTVIIDHGFGLFSLYSHLSHLGVKEGQKVQKGEIIGRTGATGLAGGDHLHFGILVHNTFVNPVEWWDAAWIENNIASKLIQDIAAEP